MRNHEKIHCCQQINLETQDKGSVRVHGGMVRMRFLPSTFSLLCCVFFLLFPSSLRVSCVSSLSSSSPVMWVSRVEKVFVRVHGTCGACYNTHNCPRNKTAACWLLRHEAFVSSSCLRSSSPLIWVYWWYPSRANTRHVHPCCGLSQACLSSLDVKKFLS